MKKGEKTREKNKETMAKYSKYNIIYLLQKWMDSVSGQTFMNYAYSWGAAVVILGTLFKLTHLAGADIMLFIGMGTEVFVFFIAAFDRPFDKTSDGRALATDSELAAELAKADEEEEKQEAGTEHTISGTIIFGNEKIYSGTQGTLSSRVYTESGSQIAGNAEMVEKDTAVSGTISGTEVAGTAGRGVGAPAPAVSNETAIAMEEATTTYVDRLNELNNLLLKVGAQSERLTTDSQEMENLNRTLTGIARVYEMQLKSASQQITTQDEINDQTKKLVQQIAELNSIYARMIEAMSVNMKQ